MRLFDIGGGDTPNEVTSRILTVPNVLSVLRLLILPFVYGLVVDGRYLPGLVVAGIFAATDWLDGYVARQFNQVTRLGQLLDPASDRLFIITLVVAMVVADLVPLWLAVVIAARDVVLLVAGLVVLRRGLVTPPVTLLGKATTFLLMSSLPMLLWGGHLAQQGSDAADVVRTIGLVAMGVAAVLYWVIAIGYGRTLAATSRGDA